MAELEPIKDEQLQPVMVELDAGEAGAEDATVDKPQAQANAREDKSALTLLTEQLEAAKQAQALEAERADRAEADRLQALEYARKRDQEAAQARHSQAATEADMVQSAISSAQAEQEAAKAAYRTAFEAGDADGMTEATARISRSATDIRQYEQAAATLAERQSYARQAAQQAAQQPQPQRRTTPADIMASVDHNPKLIPKEKEWLKNHPEAVIDPKVNTRLSVGYEMAVERGITRGSDEYFKFLDEFMGYKSQPANAGARVSAPVSRDSYFSGGGSRAKWPNSIELNETEQDIARSAGLTFKEYAVAKAAREVDRKNNPQNY